MQVFYCFETQSAFFLHCFRCKVDVCALPSRQANYLELPLGKQAESLLMVISISPCSGVSISDLCLCPLGDPNERKQISQRYVSFACLLSFLV